MVWFGLQTLRVGVRASLGIARALFGVIAEVVQNLWQVFSESWVGVLVLLWVARMLWRRGSRARLRRAARVPMQAETGNAMNTEALDETPETTAAPQPRQNHEHHPDQRGHLDGAAQVSQPRRAASATGSTHAQLVARTGVWLSAQRPHLPQAAHVHLDRILQHLQALALQLQQPPSDDHTAQELQRLLADELPQLVTAYDQVPKTLRERSLHGGSTAKQQLTAGLLTIEAELARIHERLAADALKALATHQRFLDLKYGSEAPEL